MILADLGADVVKVEAPGAGDYARTRAPLRQAGDPQVASASFIGLNRNKRSAVLDLKSDEGRAVALSLVERFDVVIESFRPGVLDRLGLGYEALRVVNPRIVLCSMNGWGSTGTMAQVPAHDLNYCGMLGILAPSGDPDDEPLIPTGQWADTAGALFAAVGIMAAVHERDRSGVGQHIEVVLAHAALWSMAMPLAGALAARSAPARREGRGPAVSSAIRRIAARTAGWPSGHSRRSSGKHCVTVSGAPTCARTATTRSVRPPTRR